MQVLPRATIFKVGSLFAFKFVGLEEVYKRLAPVGVPTQVVTLAIALEKAAFVFLLAIGIPTPGNAVLLACDDGHFVDQHVVVFFQNIAIEWLLSV